MTTIPVTASTNPVCRHPRKARIHDQESNEVVCGKCGSVLERLASSVSVEKLGRAPTNAIVFNSNLGSVTKLGSKKSAQPHHLHCIASIYGTLDGSKQPIETITDTCGNCKREVRLKIFGPTICCEGCGSELAFYTLRRNPNGHGNATRFWADLRQLQALDAPDDDPILRVGREILSEKLLGHVRDEDAHWIAQKCIAGLKQLSKVTRRQVEALIDSVIEGEGILCKSN